MMIDQLCVIGFKREFGNWIQIGSKEFVYLSDNRWVDEYLKSWDEERLCQEVVGVLESFRGSEILSYTSDDDCIRLASEWFISHGLEPSIQWYSTVNHKTLEVRTEGWSKTFTWDYHIVWESEKYEVLECTGDPLEEVKSWLETRGLDWSVSFNEETGELVVQDGLGWSDVTQLEKQWCLF